METGPNIPYVIIILGTRAAAARCPSCYVQIDQAVTQIFAHEIPTASPPWITLRLHASQNNKLALPQSNRHRNVKWQTRHCTTKHQWHVASTHPQFQSMINESTFPGRGSMPLVSSACHKLISSRALPFCKQIGRCFLNKPLSYLHANHLKLSTLLNSQSDSCPLSNRPIKGQWLAHTAWKNRTQAAALVATPTAFGHFLPQDPCRTSQRTPRSHPVACTDTLQNNYVGALWTSHYLICSLALHNSNIKPPDKPDPGCRSCRGTHSPGCSLPSLRHATLHVKYQNEKAPWGQAAHTSHLAQDQPPTSHETIFDTYPVPHKHISHLSARSIRFKSTTGSQSRHVLPSQAAPPIHVTIWRPIRTQCTHGWHYRVSKCTQGWRAIVGPPLGEHFRCCVREAAANRTAPLEIRPARRQACPNNRTHLQPNSISIPTRLSYSLYLASPLSPYLPRRCGCLQTHSCHPGHHQTPRLQAGVARHLIVADQLNFPSKAVNDGNFLHMHIQHATPEAFNYLLHAPAVLNTKPCSLCH